jgi:GntR family transcriptional repressor for pyruvate dehydrogenase complex
LSGTPNFRPIAPRQKIYSAIVEQILESIRRGVHPPGSSLPPERELAVQLDVSRASLREAVRVLEHAGVLEVRSGSGTYVTAESASNVTTLRARTALLGEHSPLDLIAVRLVVEPAASRFAAADHNTRDLQLMEAQLHLHAAMLQAGQDPTEPDLRFHLAVSAAAHNDVLYEVQEFLTDLMREDTWTGMKGQARRKGDSATQYLRHHELIYSAVDARDADAAAQHMVDHLQSVRDAMSDDASLGE